MTDFSTCIKDLNPVINDFGKALHLFKDGSFEEFAEGLDFFGQSISHTGKMLLECSKLDERDLSKMSKMFGVFLRPMELTVMMEHHMLKHGSMIEKDFKDAMTDYNHGEFEKAGEKFGTAASIMIWGIPE